MIHRSCIYSLCGLAACVLAGGFSSVAHAQTQELQPSGIREIQTILEEKFHRTPAQQKLESHLLMAGHLHRYALRTGPMPSLAHMLELMEFDAHGNVHVDIRGAVSEALLARIAALGGRVEWALPEQARIRAWIPLLSAEALSGRPDVEFIELAARFAPGSNLASGGPENGNSRAWEGGFESAAADIPVFDARNTSAVMAHAFLASPDSSAFPPSRGPVALRWSDPPGASCNDYDLFVMNSTLTHVLDSSTNTQTCSQDPFEQAMFSGEAGNRIVVVLFSGAPRSFRVDTQRHGPLHIVPKMSSASRPLSASGPTAPVCLNSMGGPGTCLFHYYGGPVISHVDVVVVYWGSSVSSVVNCGGGTDAQGCIGVSRLYGAVTNSTYMDMLQEYNTAGVNANAGSKTGLPGTSQLVGRGTLHAGSPFIITVTAPNSGNPITDANIQNEIQAQITAGHLPATGTDGMGNANTIYMVYFPPNLVISDPNIGTSCVQFCAYHSTYAANTLDVPYGVIPDFTPPSGCASGCGAGTQFQNIGSASSHELGEAITDEAVGIGTTVDFPLAWYDAINGEIGDMCNQAQNVLQYDAISFTVQQLFSQKAYNANPNAGCVFSATTFTLAAPAAGAPGSPFSVTVTANNGDGSKYLGTVHFTSSDGAASLPANYTFTVLDAGSHTFTGGVTLNTSGTDTITVSDAHQAATPGTATVNVSAAAPAVGLSPAFAFFGPQTLGTSSGQRSQSLSNTGSAPLTISSIALSGANSADFTLAHTCPLSPSTLAAGSSCMLNTVFSPTAGGPRKTGIVINDNAAGGPHTLVVTGVGTSVSISPASLTFGPTTVGSTSPSQMVTIMNKSGTAMNLRQIAILGTNAGDFLNTTTCGTTLAAGANCTVTVSFKPSATGARSASLLFSDDAGASPQSVPLTGTGQ